MSQALFITDLLKELRSQYLDFLEDAIKFFKEYDGLYGVYAKKTAKIDEVDEQLATINNYKEKHGVYPNIKDQPDCETYINELMKVREKKEFDLREIKPKVIKGFEQRRKMLDKIASTIINATIKEKDANKYLATIILRAPLESDHTRCPNNEKNKPLYIAGMVIRLLMKLLDEDLIDNEYIVSRKPIMIPAEDNPKQLEPEPMMLKEFKNSVLIPIVQAALIHHIGSYSLDAERIFRGNRYRLLDEPTRKKLVKIIYDNTLNYFEYGLGRPNEEDNESFAEDMVKFELTEDLLKHFTNSQHPMGNLIRIPMIYSSFMLSTKPKHEYLLMYKAYDILNSGIEKGVIYQPYSEEFKKMVGRYPLGTGVFFISKETHVPERGVVIGLNPTKPSNAIVKQLTRRQLQFDDHTQVEVSREYLVNNEVARKNSDFGPEYYSKQFPQGYFWNPAALWERDIHHVRFWRRDNQVKQN